ncbi:MAG TPA: hypothetical protein P5121_22015 [Caldilineaceae bacterium]|nr:hypothetical protein [Caldilineaceae bacterium]
MIETISTGAERNGVTADQSSGASQSYPYRPNITDRSRATANNAYTGATYANIYGVRVLIGRTVQDADYLVQGAAYLTVLWCVSLLALVTNGALAIVRKITHDRQRSLPQILWAMGRNPRHISSPFVDCFSRYNRWAKTGAASWQALDLFYHYRTKIQPQLGNDMEGRLTRFWIERMHNRQAVTTRLAIATQLIATELLRYQEEPVIRIVSIVTGSTEAIIQAILQSGVRNVAVIVLDSNAEALGNMRARVTAAGLDTCFTFVQGTTRRLDALCLGNPPHIIEMIGFLDYRTDEKAIDLVRTIHDGLAPGGIFFTGNIHPNPERIFLDWVLLWPMCYRTADQLSNLLITGDFMPQNIQLHYEPFQIHGIAACRKSLC